jgi:hypothetical protein
VSIQVPPTVSVGSDVFLRCLFDVEGDNLYMLKWYRGKDEFYRYVPKELPSTQVFSLPGFKVDVSQKHFFCCCTPMTYISIPLACAVPLSWRGEAANASAPAQVNAISPAAAARAFDLTLCTVASVMEKHNKTLRHFPARRVFLFNSGRVSCSTTFFLLFRSPLSCWMHFVLPKSVFATTSHWIELEIMTGAVNCVYTETCASSLCC